MRAIIVLVMLLAGCDESFNNKSTPDASNPAPDGSLLPDASIDAPLPPADASVPPQSDGGLPPFGDGGFPPFGDGGFPFGDGAAACTFAELQPIGTCGIQNCASSPNITVCLATNCPQELLGLSSECATCILTSAGGGITDIVTSCALP